MVSRYPGLLEHLERSGLANNPHLIRYAASFAEKSGDALAKIEELKKNPAYWNAGDPDHDRLVEEVVRQYQRAYGSR